MAGKNIYVQGRSGMAYMCSGIRMKAESSLLFYT